MEFEGWNTLKRIISKVATFNVFAIWSNTINVSSDLIYIGVMTYEKVVQSFSTLFFKIRVSWGNLV